MADLPRISYQSFAGSLAQLSEQKGVLGVMALTRNGALIQRDGDVFSGDAGKTYARVVHRMVEAIVRGVTELEQDVSRSGQ
jgi:hypothetical protein